MCHNLVLNTQSKDVEIGDFMEFCNINFNILKKEELFTRRNDETKYIATMNAQLIVFANTIQRYYNFINANYATFDGEIPLRWAKRKNKYFKNAIKLSGSEIVYDFCSYAKKNNLKVFFLGGRTDSNTKSVNIIKNEYEINIKGYSPNFENYPFSEDFINNCKDEIQKFGPDIVFIAFGSPKQEFFIEDNMDFFKKLNIQFVIGCGGTFDFISGNIKRAPSFISQIGLESLYRFIREISWARFNRIIFSFKFFKYINHKPNFE